MKKTVVPLLAAILGGLIAFGFQNCSAPKNSTTAVVASGESSAAAGNGLPLDPLQIPEVEIQSMVDTYALICTNLATLRPIDFTVIGSGKSLTTAFSDTKFYAGSKVGTVTIGGTFNFLGSIDGGGAKITKVALNNGGTANICNASLGTAGGTGIVAVAGGTLSTIDTFVGNIVIIGGDIPATIKGMKGNVYARTASGQLKGRRFL